MNSKIYIGYLYGIAHFCIEFICFYIIASKFTISGVVLPVIAISYDFLAFVPQIIFGYIYDKRFNIPIEIIAILLMFFAIITSSFDGLNILMLIMLTIGNAILHETGAVVTTSVSEGKLSHSAIFVSGGSFGLVLGQIAGKYGVSPLLMYLALVIIAVIIVITRKELENRNIPKFDIVKKNINVSYIIIIAFVVVMVRSFLGYAIPISWKKEIWHSILLFFVMGFGKALGGILSDKFGAKVVGVSSTLLCIPFLIIGDSNMVVSVIGVFMFSMTMSITFGMLLSVMDEYIGVAFGITTIGLYLGVVPTFLFSFTKTANIICVVILSIACSIALFYSLEDKKNNSKGH